MIKESPCFCGATFLMNNREKTSITKKKTKNAPSLMGECRGGRGAERRRKSRGAALLLRGKTTDKRKNDFFIIIIVILK